MVGAAGPGERSEAAGTREKRSRDRYGRDHAPRSERTEPADRQQPASRDNPPMPEDATSEPRKSYFTASTETPVRTVAPSAFREPVTAMAETVTRPVIVAPATPDAPSSSVVAAAILAPVSTAPTAEAVGMPKLQSFELPVAELAGVAQNSGLSWVNSNVEKIAAVQAAIAAEPKPIRVPRERPAVVQVPASPLVLVETKRDLRNMTLPFEDTTPE
jgi:ribonuclease E